MVVRSAGLEPARPVGHPVLSRARLPEDSATSADATTVEFSRVVRGAGFRVPVAVHTRLWVRCWLLIVHRATGVVEGIFRLKLVGALLFWPHRTIGMSGDVPSSANTKSERYMRLFFWPKLPVGAHAH